MHAVVRNYSGAGAKELADLLEERKPEIETLIGSVTGLVMYSFARSDGNLGRPERLAMHGRNCRYPV